MTVETVPMDDKELFQSAIADEPKTETPVEEPQTDERARDEQGRFAPKEPKEDAPIEAEAAPIQQQEQKPDDSKDGQVPSWRLREVREAREAAEKRANEASSNYQALQAQFQTVQEQLQALQKPKEEPVDFYADPDAALKQRITPIQQQFESLASHLTYRASLAENIATHGNQTVSDMRKALVEAAKNNSPDIARLDQEMNQSPDPVGVAMNWYNNRPEKVKERFREEALKDPEFLAKALEAAKAAVPAQAQSDGPKIKLPPSLNKATGAGGSSVDDGDVSDRGLFKYAMGSPRR